MVFNFTCLITTPLENELDSYVTSRQFNGNTDIDWRNVSLFMV